MRGARPIDWEGQRDRDIELLEYVLREYNDGRAALSGQELNAFSDMRLMLAEDSARELSPAQRQWIERVEKEIREQQADKQLLDQLIELDLGNSLLDAFEGMRDRFEGNRNRLTEKQRAWALRTAEEHGLVLPGTGPVPEGLPRSERLLPWEREGYEKPVKPPGLLPEPGSFTFEPGKKR